LPDVPRRKRVTGKELIRALNKAGFAVIRTQAATIACVTQTAASPLYPSTPAKPLVQVCWDKSCATAI